MHLPLALNIVFYLSLVRHTNMLGLRNESAHMTTHETNRGGFMTTAGFRLLVRNCTPARTLPAQARHDSRPIRPSPLPVLTGRTQRFGIRLTRVCGADNTESDDKNQPNLASHVSSVSLFCLYPHHLRSRTVLVTTSLYLFRGRSVPPVLLNYDVDGDRYTH